MGKSQLHFMELHNNLTMLSPDFALLMCVVLSVVLGVCIVTDNILFRPSLSEAFASVAMYVLLPGEVCND